MTLPKVQPQNPIGRPGYSRKDALRALDKSIKVIETADGCIGTIRENNDRLTRDPMRLRVEQITEDILVKLRELRGVVCRQSNRLHDGGDK